MEQVQIQLFGRIRVSSGNAKSTDFPGHKRGALLAYLAHHAGQSLHREDVADALWPDGDPDSNRHRLRQELAALRRQLDDAGIPSTRLLRSTREDLQLDDAAARVDSRMYQESLRLARRIDDRSRRAGFLEEAAQLYAGPFVKDYDLPWTRQIRSHLEAEHRKVLMELGEMRMGRGELDRAVDAFQGVLLIDPLDEAAHLRLIRLFAEHDQLAQAVQQYRQLERILRDELGVAPPLEAQELLEQLRTRRPQASAPQAGNQGSRPDSAQPVSAQTVTPASETKPPAEQPPPTPGRPAPHIRQRRRRRPAPALWVVAALGLVTLAAALLSLRGRHAESSTSGPSGPPALQAEWEKGYEPRPGELPDSEPTAIAPTLPNPARGIYLCGFTKTEKEDIDIVTQRYSEEGTLQWSRRYSSPEHDADRSYAVVPFGSGVYVVGETYVPSGHGVKEGWRHIVLAYDENGKKLWEQRHPEVLWEKDTRVICGFTDGLEAVLVGGSLDRSGKPLAMVARYDRTGKLLWTRTILPGGAVSSRLLCLVAGPDDAYYACGRAEVAGSAAAVQSAGFVCRINRDGSVPWVKTQGGGYGGGNAFVRLATHPSGLVYAAGDFFGGDLASGGAGQTLGVGLYGADGSQSWFRLHHTAGPAFTLRSMMCNLVGNLFLNGSKGAPDGSSDALTACYDPGGNRIWEQQCPGNSKLGAAAMGLYETEGRIVSLVGFYNPPFIASHTAWQVQQYSGKGEMLGSYRHGRPAITVDRIGGVSADRHGIYVASQAGTPTHHVITVLKLAPAP